MTRQKGPCRTCRFSDLLADGNLECTFGPPSPVAIETRDGKIVSNNGLQWFHSRMSIGHTGCWQWEKSTKKKVLPEPPAPK
jgi:hypothetical protein